MADLIITYTRAVSDPPRNQIIPLEVGSDVETEVEVIGGSSVATTAAANAQRRIASLLAGADCWIAIGAAPTAVAAGATCRKMLAGERLQFLLTPGEKVAVIQA